LTRIKAFFQFEYFLLFLL